jgi:hypothetical protein
MGLIPIGATLEIALWLALCLSLNLSSTQLFLAERGRALPPRDPFRAITDDGWSSFGA